MIKVILVEDLILFRESLAFFLTKSHTADVIAEASNGEEFLDLLEKNYKPDLVLMDIAMPVMNGIEATKTALSRFPDLKIMVLSAFGDEKYYYQMIDAGVKGFVLKDSNKAELEQAIQAVAGGGIWFSSELLKNVIVSFGKQTHLENKLSDRETEVLQHICNGLTNEQIAEELNLSYDTIRKHRSNILSKTGCVNTAALVMYAIKNKLVDI